MKSYDCGIRCLTALYLQGGFSVQPITIIPVRFRDHVVSTSWIFGQQGTNVVEVMMHNRKPHLRNIPGVVCSDFDAPWVGHGRALFLKSLLFE